jgi:hypothetical protein
MSVEQQAPPLWHLRDSVAKLDMDTNCIESKQVVYTDPAPKESPGTKRPSKTSVATSCTFPDTLTIDSWRRDHDASDSQHSCDEMTVDRAGRERREQKPFGGGRDGGSDLHSRLIARALLHNVINDQLVGSSTGIVSSNVQRSNTSLRRSTSNRRAVLDNLMSTCSGSISGAFLSASPRPRSLSYSSSDIVSVVSSGSIPVKNVDVVEIQRKHEPDIAPPVDTSEEPHVSKKWHKSSTREVTFSVREIRKSVVESIPKSVGQQISPEAWDRIFNENDAVHSDNYAATSPSRLAEDEASDLISVISAMIGKEVDQDDGQNSVFSDITEGFLKIVPTTIDDAEVLGSPVPHAPGEMVPRELSFHKLNDEDDEKENPSVKFHAVHVRYYERILSDNPAVSAGPSVGLGWKYEQAPKTYHIDEWEDMRVCSRRSLEQLVLPRYERTTMVIELGYSHKQIADVIRKSLRIKHNRKVTFNNLRVQKMEEFMEKMTRRLKKLVTFGFMIQKDKKSKY